MKHKTYQSFFKANHVKQVIMNQHHLDDIMKLQQEVIDEQKDQLMYRFTSRKNYEEMLRNKAYIIGLYIDENLIAFACLLMPNTFDQRLLAFEPLNKVDNNLVYYYRAVAVSAKYRGNKIQKFFIEHFDSRIHTMDGVHMILNVHPNNTFSIQNFIDAGYTKYGSKTIDQVYDRSLYFKKIK